jgi:hypothetical protein
MQRKITGFHLDEEGHWVAELECGHNQHVRHDPPYVERPWVITEHGRRSRLGQELNCVRCDEDDERLGQIRRLVQTFSGIIALAAVVRNRGCNRRGTLPLPQPDVEAGDGLCRTEAAADRVGSSAR